MRYYTLTDGVPVPLSTPVLVGGRWIIHPTAEQAAALGAYPLADNPAPEPPAGKTYRANGCAVQNGEIVTVWELADAPAPAPRTFSKLKIVAALTSAGVWAQAKAWLEQAGYYDLFLAAQVFREDYDAFATGKAALATALGWSDAEVETLLSNCLVEN